MLRLNVLVCDSPMMFWRTKAGLTCLGGILLLGLLFLACPHSAWASPGNAKKASTEEAKEVLAQVLAQEKYERTPPATNSADRLFAWLGTKLAELRQALSQWFEGISIPSLSPKLIEYVVYLGGTLALLALIVWLVYRKFGLEDLRYLFTCWRKKSAKEPEPVKLSDRSILLRELASQAPVLRTLSILRLLARLDGRHNMPLDEQGKTDRAFVASWQHNSLERKAEREVLELFEQSAFAQIKPASDIVLKLRNRVLSDTETKL